MILVSVQTLYIISSYYVVPDLFDKPEVFNPDRYLLTEHGTIPGMDDQHFRSSFPFGAGRVRHIPTFRVSM